MTQEYQTVAELLAVPERWCRGELALTRTGRATSPLSESACRWCLSGAMQRIYGLGTKKYRAARKRLGAMVVPFFNDNRTHAEVLAVVKKSGI